MLPTIESLLQAFNQIRKVHAALLNDRMKEEQKSIYYACGTSIEEINRNPVMAKLREKHMLLPAAILTVLAGVLLFYDFIGFLTYLGARLIWSGISLVPYLYFRYKEKEAQETLPTENISL